MVEDITTIYNEEGQSYGTIVTSYETIAVTEYQINSEGIYEEVTIGSTIQATYSISFAGNLVALEDHFKMDDDFDTSNAKYKSAGRYVFGWTDPRGIYGSAGA